MIVNGERKKRKKKEKKKRKRSRDEREIFLNFGKMILMRSMDDIFLRIVFITDTLIHTCSHFTQLEKYLKSRFQYLSLFF